MASEIRLLLKRTELRRILVGLSGGADSVALLALLGRLRPQIELKAIHCNFGLRGEESIRDEEFSRRLCSSQGVELEVVRFDTYDEARRRKVSIEVACRELRYSLFRDVMRKEGWQRVAVAHHADDNAETLLLNLMRGSGLKGLRGMSVDNGEVWRPLLPFNHNEILACLEEIGLDHVEDSTNTDSDFNRNFLRNKVIPLLERRWPHARRMIARSAELMGREYRLMEEAIALPPEHPLMLKEVLNSPEPETLIYYYIRQVGGTPEMAFKITRCLNSSSGWSGRVWHIPGGSRISLERDQLDILPQAPVPMLPLAEEIITLDAEVWKRIRSADPTEEVWLPRPLREYEVRTIREGDRIYKGGKGGSALVSKIMKDAALTRRLKESTPLIVDPLTGEIIWIAGLRRSALGLVPASAQCASRITLK